MAELAELLSQQANISKREAQQFLTTMIETIRDGINEDKLVKIKGLGTFKVIDVDARESVNVNTGERVTIGSHQKLTFTPDSSMKELVNKPFSQFETVVLNDGIEFEDIKNNTVEPDNTIESDDLIEPDNTLISESKIQESEQIVEDKNKEVSPSEKYIKDQDTHHNYDSVEEVTPSHSKKWTWIATAFVTCVISFVAGYFTGINYGIKDENHNLVIIDDGDSCLQIAETDSLSCSVSDTIKSLSNNDTLTDSTTIINEPDNQEPEWKVYEKNDSRVRTGAYAIVGTDTIIKVRPNDTTRRISRRILGEGMECYIEVYNNITAETPLIEGTEIKIPKLKLKKYLKK